MCKKADYGVNGLLDMKFQLYEKRESLLPPGEGQDEGT
jgi:hypothetical protein